MKPAVALLALCCLLFAVAACNTGSAEDQRASAAPGDDDDNDPADDDAGDDDAADDDTADDDDDTGDDDTAADDDDDDTVDDGEPPADCVEPTDGMEISEDTAICPREEPYYLVGSASGVIHITASNVTLWGDGVTLVGDGSEVGIYVTAAELSNITVRGFTLKNYLSGVRGYGRLTDVTLRDLTIEDSTDSHVYIGPNTLPGSPPPERILMGRLTVRNSKNTGVVCANCLDSTMRNITSTNNRAGVVESNLVLLSGSGNTIEDNYIFTRNSLGCNAIWLTGVDSSTVRNNVVDTGYKDGSHQHGSSHILFTGNDFTMETPDANTVFPVPLNTITLAGLCAAFPAGYNPPLLKGEIQSENNSYVGNTFRGGIFADLSINPTFCVDGVGNDFLDGAIYDGSHPDGGTCP
jgi:Right handed beta helix region